MTDTQTRREFTSDEIAAYIGTEATVRCLEADPSGELQTGIIAHAIAIIGAREPHEPEHDGDLVEAAVENLFDWLGDYGVRVSDYQLIK